MTVGSVNYPSPVMVNGISCRNCADVALAQKGIDPAHPKSGPFDRDAATDTSRQETDPVKIAAARRAADHLHDTIASYSPAGPIHAAPPPGSAFALQA